MRKTGEYGEFFPIALCPFGYNETMAMDAFPLSFTSAISQGFRWYEEPKKELIPQTCVIPNDTQEISDTLSTEIFECHCGKNFKIILPEISFYKKLKIPIPQNCPSCRHTTRMAKRNPLKLYEGVCGRCKKLVKTSYSPQKPEIILCKDCYQKEVY